MDGPVTLGILGVASITDRLLPAFRACQSVRLAAVASRDVDRAKKAAARYGCRAVGGYDELLADPEIDAVYVPLPNHLHREWVERAAAAGKHVWCEKPMGLDAGEVAAMVTACERHNVRLMDGYMWPHHPRTRKVESLIASGAIGPLQKVVASFTFLMDEFDPAVFRLRPESGGGGLYDVGCYCVNAACRFLGAVPTHAFAAGTAFNGVDVDLSVVLTFPEGRSAHFDCGFSSPLRTRVELVGRTGTVEIPNLWIPDDQAVFHVVQPGEGFAQAVETIATPGADQMVEMMNEFAAAIRSGREVMPSPSHSVTVARVMHAVLESFRTRQEVAVK